jgi:hypothetical protein
MKRLYHFTSTKHAFDDIRNRRLKIAQLEDLNDPFEFQAVNLCDPVHAQAFYGIPKAGSIGFLAEIARRFGVLCFSEDKSDLLQWAHYADHHRGICLGFDVESEGKFGPVEYVSERLPWPEQLDQNFMWELLRTKSVDWKYEKEWRVFTQMKEGISDKCTGRVLYFADFGAELILREVILGAANKSDATDVPDAIKGYPETVDVQRMHLTCDTFKLECRPA